MHAHAEHIHAAHNHAKHAHIIHAYAVNAHEMSSRFYLRINSDTPNRYSTQTIFFGFTGHDTPIQI